MQKSVKIALGIILICLVIAGGVFWYYSATEKRDNNLNKVESTNIDTSNNVNSNSGAAVQSEADQTKIHLTAAQSEALNYYEQGLKLYYDHKMAEALVLFNKALEIDSQCYQAINGKGAAYAFQGRYSEGIALIKKAIQMKPDFVYARFNLGLAYELAGNWDESIKAYHEALRLDNKDIWSYYGIASIYGREGNVEKVIEYLKPAIDLDIEVKDVAREERDFNPVKNDPRFIELIKK